MVDTRLQVCNRFHGSSGEGVRLSARDTVVTFFRSYCLEFLVSHYEVRAWGAKLHAARYSTRKLTDTSGSPNVQIFTYDTTQSLSYDAGYKSAYHAENVTCSYPGRLATTIKGIR